LIGELKTLPIVTTSLVHQSLMASDKQGKWSSSVLSQIQTVSLLCFDKLS